MNRRWYYKPCSSASSSFFLFGLGLRPWLGIPEWGGPQPPQSLQACRDWDKKLPVMQKIMLATQPNVSPDTEVHNFVGTRSVSTEPYYPDYGWNNFTNKITMCFFAVTTKSTRDRVEFFAISTLPQSPFFYF
jgi:hypothetical protein